MHSCKEYFDRLLLGAINYTIYLVILTNEHEREHGIDVVRVLSVLKNYVVRLYASEAARGATSVMPFKGISSSESLETFVA